MAAHPPPPDAGFSDAGYPGAAAGRASSVSDLDTALVGCRACPRLVAWREQVAATGRKAFRDWSYWGRPVPGFGPHDAAVLIVGLAPAAHGANRTGRMFTGDRSGDVLFAALHALGLASQPESLSIEDGMRLRGVRMTAPVHCAPPDNKPSTTERATCRAWLDREIELMSGSVRSLVVLGRYGWQAVLPVLRSVGWQLPSPLPSFGHGAHYELVPEPSGGARVAGPGASVPRSPLGLFGCYHVSQQNTFTGRLTPQMLRDVLQQAAAYAGLLE